MILRSGSLLKCCFVLLLVALPGLAETATTKKSKPKPAATLSQKSSRTGGSKSAGKATAARRKSGSSQGTSSKTTSKKGRIPRTLRTIPVSPAVRENALTRVQEKLDASATSPFTYPTVLRRFFSALAEEQNERAKGAGGANLPALSKTVRVLQYGDSHTAADIFTGEMRTRLQQQFGDGGLGFQFPGHPFAGYHLAGSLRSQTLGWFTEGNRFNTLGDGDLGMGGISIETSQPEQSITLETTCTTMQLHFLQQPGGGRLQFLDNGVALSTLNTATEAETATNSAGTFAYSCTPGLHDFEFRTLDRAPVKLLGIVTEQPGVTYECIGLNGAVAPLMLRWNPALFNDYLRQRSPNLIVLAYGTNEAGSSAAHLEDYPTDFANILDNLHRVAPNASVLVLGPPDRAMASGRGRRASWRAFSGTDRIILMQKEACRLHGCTFWDTRRRMGGFGAMQQWVAAGWAQPDRTHLTGTGYRALADALYADLIRAYNLYQQHPETPVEESRNGKAAKNP